MCEVRNEFKYAIMFYVFIKKKAISRTPHCRKCAAACMKALVDSTMF